MMATPVISPPTILVLTTDAFGGRGGIARYMRDVLLAACEWRAGQGSLFAIPRRISDPPGALPTNLRYLTVGASGRLGALRALLQALREARRFDLVICGHVLLLPMASLVSRLCRCPCLLFGYGIDVWQPPTSRLRRHLARRVDGALAISSFTADQMCAWMGFPRLQVTLLPPCVDLSAFTPGPRDGALAARYGLAGRRILLTLARLDARERYKGIDEIIALLPSLATTFPDLSYLVVGDGDDRPRLQQHAAAVGVADRVVFAGWIPDEQKVAHYRLADAFAMPSRGEGFGIVFLEAMACGVPVLASTLDGSREAVLDGQLGLLADPRVPADLQAKLEVLLRQPRGKRPEGLSAFAYPAFARKVHTLLDAWTPGAGSPR
jgi:glycosyltransferase involved in cell wall biosynthesis